MKRLVSLALALVATSALAQEVTLEEIKVEGAFVSPLDLPVTNALQKFIDGLRLQDDLARSLELREANKSSVSKILDLTRYSPIGLGASDPRIDTFMLQNYMRPDLNPRESNPLGLPK